ncbi:hypothetical protein GH5_04477 [Leishmania sp. Ghana 2012 LV757]|uniref:hypothetical protein n=1 Tax=Leishmania sp. Ghana 2012 LV757 TaxID=2803181 RepID=UPI001B40D87B|nr:hypothetical protein GH5_04477 [Leishmania sp. Ghana 2012 LV757]
MIMSSYVNVSGLSTAGEDDALQRLLASSGACGNGPKAISDAMRKIQAENAFDLEEDATFPAIESAPLTKAANLEKSSASHASAERSKASAVSLREPKTTSASTAPSPSVPSAALPEQASSFHASNPTDVDSLPSLVELVHPKLRRPLMDSMKIESLTRIQKLCWAAMLDGASDVLVRSETGSGKTLAYALPTLHRLLVECEKRPISRDVGTLVIIMCPTRELVLQVTETVNTLLRCAQFITVGGIHGGENRHKEKARLRKGLPILVTTPGRLLDHLKTTASFNVAHAQTVIMDEADRLLDMGFEKALRDIMEQLEKKCRHASNLKRILVSATITDGVERLSHFALRKNIARIGETQDTFSVPTTLKQHYVMVPVKHRLSVLLSFLRSQLDAGAGKIIVFVSTADGTEFLYLLASRLQSPFYKKYEGRVVTRSRGTAMSMKKMVEAANRHLDNGGATDEVVTFEEVSDDEVEADATLDSPAASQRAFLDANVFKLHGNMSQVDRAAVFHAFKFGTGKPRSDKSILFCTDVAARGLDMPKIDWIVHYDPPTDPTSYVHRIGRTARIGNSGDSILFLAPEELRYADYLTHFIHSQMQESDRKEAAAMSERKYETFLFYLTKLDPKSNHMWMQSTAALERAISRLAMQRDTKRGESAMDSLYRVALFAFQSYLRAYAGLPRQIKSLFFSATPHLGHVAQSFGIDKSPSEVQRELQAYIREDRALARDNRKGTVTNSRDEEGGKKKRQRVELDHDERYHSMLAQKQRKLTRDWAEKRREESTKIRPLQFSEFDA